MLTTVDNVRGRMTPVPARHPSFYPSPSARRHASLPTCRINRCVAAAAGRAQVRNLWTLFFFFFVFSLPPGRFFLLYGKRVPAMCGYRIWCTRVTMRARYICVKAGLETDSFLIITVNRQYRSAMFDWRERLMVSRNFVRLDRIAGRERKISSSPARR